jgi:phosphopantetheinyl transferase
MLELFCCPLRATDTPLDAALLSRYQDFLNKSERERLSKFLREEPRTAFLASRALLRSVLAEKLQCDPLQLQIEPDANDKPQLISPQLSPPHKLHFNLSHCQGWVVLAVSDSGPVGVDIESTARGNNILGIAKRFFQPDEFALLAALPEDERAQLFCELWTLKEAMVKAAGLGIGRMLAGVGVGIRNEKIEWNLREDFAEVLPSPMTTLYAIESSFRLAVVSLQGGLETAAIKYDVPLVCRRDWKLFSLASSHAS